MNCYQAQFLMDMYIANDPGRTIEKRRVFEGHLQYCTKCAKEYEAGKRIIDLVRKYWIPDNNETLAQPRGERESAKHRMTVEEGWNDLLNRCPDLALAVKRQKRLRLLRQASQVAACLVIGVSVFWVFSIHSKPQITQKPAPQQAAFVSKPSIKIELMSKNGNILVPANQQIVTKDELKALVINDKHRLVMNTNTVLAVEPLVEYSNIGCLVKLDSGRIYTHVQHDGNPFVVDTAHGKAVITGTTFDIKVTNNSTTLVVSKGTVQFKSGNGAVKVAAGQRSEIVGRSAPSDPISCNIDELTAWATGYKPRPVLAQAESNPDPRELPLSVGKEPIVLEETDYDHWVEQKRDWFRLEFPWIFQLRDALAAQGIEVDYPKLLVKTSDIWQFVYLEVSPARFSVIDPDSLLSIASNYGFDKQWLLENVPAAKSALEKPILSENNFAGLKTFERWFDYLDETKKPEPPTPIYSFHASRYLAETRSLIWFAVRDGQYDLTDAERTEVLDLLQEEVTTACKCQNEVLYPEDEPKLSCGEDKCQEPVVSVAEYIKAMKVIEERIAEYEKHK